MTILQQGCEARQSLPEFDELWRFFLPGLSSFAAKNDLPRNEVQNIGWLAWTVAKEKGRGSGWWWAMTKLESKKAAAWWGPQGAPKVSLELLEFELAAPEKLEIECWRWPDGDLLGDLDSSRVCKKLGMSRRRAQQKIKAATAAVAAPQQDLFFSGEGK